MDDICVYVFNHVKIIGSLFALPANEEEICERLEAKNWSECTVSGSDLPMNFNEDAEIAYINQQYQAYLELQEMPIGKCADKFIKRGCVKDFSELLSRIGEIRFYVGCNSMADVAYRRVMAEYPVMRELPQSLIKYFCFEALGSDMKNKWEYIYEEENDILFEIKR